MDNQEVTLFVLLEFSAAFDTVEHSILLNVLKGDFEVSGTTSKWFDSFVSDYKQRVLISGKASDDFIHNCGVRQGSSMGPAPSLRPWLFRWHPTLLLLSTYVPGISSWVNQCSGELYLWFMPNRSMINDIKTEFLIIRSRHQLPKTTIDSIVVNLCTAAPPRFFLRGGAAVHRLIIFGESSIKSSESARNLGSWFDAQMRRNVHSG